MPLNMCPIAFTSKVKVGLVLTTPGADTPVAVEPAANRLVQMKGVDFSMLTNAFYLQLLRSWVIACVCTWMLHVHGNQTS